MNACGPHATRASVFPLLRKELAAMIKTFERETVLTYSVMPPLYVPFRNAWVKENGR